MTCGDFQAPPRSCRFLKLTPGEHNRGKIRQTDGITRTGPRALRRLLIEAAKTLRFPPRETYHLQRKAAEAPPYARERNWATQKTLSAKYRKLSNRGKHHDVVVATVARDFAGFLWDVGCDAMHANEVDRTSTTPSWRPPVSCILRLAVYRESLRIACTHLSSRSGCTPVKLR